MDPCQLALGVAVADDALRFSAMGIDVESKRVIFCMLYAKLDIKIDTEPGQKTGADGQSRRRFLLTLTGALSACLWGCAPHSESISSSTNQTSKSVTQIPTTQLNVPQGREVATFAGGCFWCTEAFFKDLKGVEKVVSGYTGGMIANPSYERVCSGDTGHAEAIQITFDPKVITYGQLLHIFFTVHDPTTLNRQGADAGTQYRSGVFYHTPEQQQTAQSVIKEVNAAHVWDNPIVTEVTAFTNFYSAESYHQDYFALNPNQGYCRIVIAPKVTKFRQHYQELLKK